MRLKEILQHRKIVEAARCVPAKDVAVIGEESIAHEAPGFLLVRAVSQHTGVKETRSLHDIKAAAFLRGPADQLGVIGDIGANGRKPPAGADLFVPDTQARRVLAKLQPSSQNRCVHFISVHHVVFDHREGLTEVLHGTGNRKNVAHIRSRAKSSFIFLKAQARLCRAIIIQYRTEEERWCERIELAVFRHGLQYGGDEVIRGKLRVALKKRQQIFQIQRLLSAQRERNRVDHIRSLPGHNLHAQLVPGPEFVYAGFHPAVRALLVELPDHGVQRPVHISGRQCDHRFFLLRQRGDGQGRFQRFRHAFAGIGGHRLLALLAAGGQ